MKFNQSDFYNYDETTILPSYIILEHKILDDLEKTDLNIQLDVSNIIAPYSDNITFNIKTNLKTIKITGRFTIENKIDENNINYYYIKYNLFNFINKNIIN